MNTDCTGLRLTIVGPYPPPFGGVASHLTTLIPGLRNRGAEDIAVVSFGDRDAVDTIDGATVYRFKPSNHLSRLANPSNWPALFATFKALSGQGFGFRRVVSEATRAALVCDIARRHRSNVSSFYQADLSLSMLACAGVWGRRKGIVLTVFGECYDNPVFFTARPGFWQRFLELPHSVAASSLHCARSFGKLGIRREVEAVYYGIDLDRFDRPELRPAYRAELGIADDELLVTYMGRFTEDMGLGRLLKIGDDLLSQLPRAKLLLAGAKGALSDAAKVFSDANPGRVHILQNLPFDLQPSVYGASDIVLAPSADQHACMGMSIKEAMAASRAVIGSDAGGIPEAIVDGETGVLVPLDDSKQVDAGLMLKAIGRLGSDAPLREHMGTAGRARAEDIFTMDRTIDRMAELFMAARPA